MRSPLNTIIHGLTNVDCYNSERADEQWERENPRVGSVCGIIMLIATIIGLLLLFGGCGHRATGAVDKHGRGPGQQLLHHPCVEGDREAAVGCGYTFALSKCLK